MLDLVYFTTRVPETSNTSTTQVTRVKHECNTNNTSVAQVRHEGHKCNTSATWVLIEPRECNRSGTWTALVEHGWKILILISTRVKTYFHTPKISYMANERLQGEEQFHSKNYLLEMYPSHAQMCLKSAPQKMSFVIAKSVSKSYILDFSCKNPCMFPHSYA